MDNFSAIVDVPIGDELLGRVSDLIFRHNLANCYLIANSRCLFWAFSNRNFTNCYLIVNSEVLNAYF